MTPSTVKFANGAAGHEDPLGVGAGVGRSQQQSGSVDQGAVVAATPSSSSPSLKTRRSQRPAILGRLEKRRRSRRSGLAANR
jgi:hypothetical protein